MLKRFWQAINWTLLSNIATSLSLVVAVASLYISNYQFKENIRSTQSQIDILDQERRLAFEEHRPILSIDSIPLDVNPELPPWNEEKYWTSTIYLQNIGDRPAFGITIYNQVLGAIVTEDGKVLSTIPIVDDTTQFSNNLPKGRSVESTSFIYYKKFRKYYIRTKLEYKDKLTDSLITESYHFEHSYIKMILYGKDESFWKSQYDEVTIAQSRHIDSLFLKAFPMNNKSGNSGSISH